MINCQRPLSPVLRNVRAILLCLSVAQQQHAFCTARIVELPTATDRAPRICDPENPGWEQQVILRADDYNHHYFTPPAVLFGWWCDMLLAAPCLFIGTSLTEPGLDAVAKYLLANYRDRLNELKHIHLVPAEAKDYEPPDNPGRSLGIVEQVCYDRIDTRYSGLLRVLSKFSHVPVNRPSPRVPVLKPITLTDQPDFTPQ